jgi:uncharacterized protein (TIGR00730 family)
MIQRASLLYSNQKGFIMSKNIVVFCGSHFGDNPAFAALAGHVGEEIGNRKDHMVYGGGRVGLMGVAADAALAAGAKVTGIIPSFFIGKEAHLGLTRLIEVPDMAARKSKLIESGDAFIVLPGGCGTMEEFFDTLSHFHIHPQLKKLPILIGNIDGFYDSLKEVLNDEIKHGFLQPKDIETIHFCQSADEIFSYL